MLTILIKAYYVDVVLDIKPIYLNRRYLFKNKFYYLDKIYFYYSYFMQHNVKMRHAASIKKSVSFLKCVVLFQNRGLHLQEVEVFHYSACRWQNCYIVLAELVRIFCCNIWKNPPVTAADHYSHYNSHHQYYYHHFHYHCKMHFYRLKILLTIPLYCNMISCLFQLNFVFFLPAYIFL